MIIRLLLILAICIPAEASICQTTSHKIKLGQQACFEIIDLFVTKNYCIRNMGYITTAGGWTTFNIGGFLINYSQSKTPTIIYDVLGKNKNIEVTFTEDKEVVLTYNRPCNLAQDNKE